MSNEIVQWILSIIGVLGTVIAIYQCAVLNESKKRRHELQFLFAGIHQFTLSKRMEWDNQISLLPKPQNDRDMEIIRVHVRARDNLMAIGNAITALESVIDTDSSAISAMFEKTIKQVELNNRLQTEGSKNPTIPSNQKMNETEQ
ncbi:hypothetical protein [Nitrosomonas sp.]|uniref:hypothetical protein n=1 Tax=Nitrosomonas sp. TaxID=42353 RepID=UPI002730CFAC|nr:hypothetical protein [Nitrosomonas sp.]MDP1787008.1 hypothetical protein [Nitrosomonas sp.]MDP2225760.1 hypothetical protein [Nitrosomonas sp.]